MEPGICLKCSGKVQGQLEGIVLTLLCQDCIYKPVSRRGRRRRFPVLHWESSARSDIHRPHLLNALRFDLSKRGCRKGKRVERRYLGVEVEALLYLPSARASAEIRLKQTERDEKKAVLEKQTGVCLDGLNPFVKFFLLGDYLSGACNTKTKHQEVMQRCRVLPGVLDILNVCKTAHPESVFQFCLEYPTGGPSEFQELRRKLHSVFHLQGFRILDELGNHELFQLKHTKVMRDVYEEYQQRDRVGCVRSYLEPLVGLTEAENITKDSVCLEYIHGHDCLLQNDRHRAEKLARFWKDRADPDEKKSRLVTGLASKKLSLPESNPKCDGYINSTQVILLDEVVCSLEGNIWDRIRQSFNPQWLEYE